MFRGSKDHSNFSGLPGLQQQTQDTLPCYVLHVPTRLHANRGGRGKRFGGKATSVRLKHNNDSVVNAFNATLKFGSQRSMSKLKVS